MKPPETFGLGPFLWARRNYEDKGQFCQLDMVKVEKVEKRAVLRGSEAVDNSDEAIPSAAAR